MFNWRVIRRKYSQFSHVRTSKPLDEVRPIEPTARALKDCTRCVEQGVISAAAWSTVHKPRGKGASHNKLISKSIGFNLKGGLQTRSSQQIIALQIWDLLRRLDAMPPASNSEHRSTGYDGHECTVCRDHLPDSNVIGTKNESILSRCVQIT